MKTDINDYFIQIYSKGDKYMAYFLSLPWKTPVIDQGLLSHLPRSHNLSFSDLTIFLNTNTYHLLCVTHCTTALQALPLFRASQYP